MLAENFENLMHQQQGKLEAAQAMVKDFGISVKDAALKLKVPLEDVINDLKKNENGNVKKNLKRPTTPQYRGVLLCSKGLGGVGDDQPAEAG